MVGGTSPHDILVAKLETRCVLDDMDRAAVRALDCTIRVLPAQRYMVREGAKPSRCALLLSGFAYRHKLAADGGRQIVGLMIPGDFTDLQHLFLREADHNVQSLTDIEVADIAIEDLRALALQRPAIGQALWVDALIEASMARETILNIGRRDGLTRLAHLLCEFEVRRAQAALEGDEYELPMTQEQIGDATGMTAVHVNRTLKQLEREGLIARSRRHVRIVDWGELQHRADFNPQYLHLHQANGRAEAGRA